ncbi:MAG: homocysteine S-methyltransferase family protein [candidate division Zixibacteria bacterium]|nr:homocysteine S-methyltransferase family protein [candidate division Zixibacteria bacterium]
MRSILDRVRQGEILVADGAMGTMLFSRGLKAGDCPEALNLTKPALLTEIAQAYFDAGAEIIQTNTFGASPLRLADYSLADQTEEINRKAVKAVRQAVGQQAYVSASCGPSAKILKPYGDTKPEAMFESFKRQVSALIDAGVDIICVETMTDLTEASLAIEATRAVSATIPVMATMTFDATPKGFFTVMGVDIETAAARLATIGADIIGSNCGNGINNMIKIARRFRKHTKLPLLIQSNAGLPEIEDGVLVYPETPEYMAGKAKDLIDAGVSIIGGCCGTTPEHIRAIRQAIE